MSRRVRTGGIILVILFLVFGGVAAAFLLSKTSQTVSEATSPDGTWTVEVVAEPRLTGSYDIVVFQRDSQGTRLPGGFVVDLTNDLAAAQRRHHISFVDDNTAHVGSRKLERPNSLRKWQ